MSVILFNATLFREQFPAFSSKPSYSDDLLQMYWNTATLYINDRKGGAYCGALNNAQRTQAIYYMTAHLAQINVLIAQGQTLGVTTGATVDKVSITLEPPPVANQWQYWLQSTPYGQQLLSLLQVAGVGGFYLGGSPERLGFRRLGFW